MWTTRVLTDSSVRILKITPRLLVIIIVLNQEHNMVLALFYTYLHEIVRPCVKLNTRDYSIILKNIALKKLLFFIFVVYVLSLLIKYYYFEWLIFAPNKGFPLITIIYIITIWNLFYGQYVVYNNIVDQWSW